MKRFIPYLLSMIGAAMFVFGVKLLAGDRQ